MSQSRTLQYTIISNTNTISNSIILPLILEYVIVLLVILLTILVNRNIDNITHYISYIIVTYSYTV